MISKAPRRKSKPTGRKSKPGGRKSKPPRRNSKPLAEGIPNPSPIIFKGLRANPANPANPRIRRVCKNPLRFASASGPSGAAGRAGGGRLSRFAGCAGLQAGREAAQLCEQSFPRGVVVHGFRRSGLMVAIESLKHLQVRPDRAEVARVDRLCGEGVRALEPHELKQRMIRRVVDTLPPQRVADDLVDAPLG